VTIRSILAAALVAIAVSGCQKASDNKQQGVGPGTAPGTGTATGTGGEATGTDLGTGTGTGGAVAATGSPECIKLVDHILGLVIADPNVPPEAHAQIRGERDDAIAQCSTQPPPAELLDCALQATSFKQYQRCQRRRASAPPKDGTRAPTADDLATYTKDLKGAGRLTATIETSMGTFHCELADDKVPMTVANFVGLATGKHAWYDEKAGKAVTGKPLYNGTMFHRVIPDFMVQGGDPRGNGTGGPGYEFADEFHPELRHKPGTLSMANSGPDTNGSQFFITEVATTHLDDMHSVFGYCDEVDLVKKITAVPTDAQNKPNTAVTIKKITIGKKSK
jgi:peptidyl-prolyl cis-trans isomerase A (cyclophilin A)